MSDTTSQNPYGACAAPSPNATPTSIGGQAVIEGVMMRGKYSWAVSARDTNGEIQSKEFDLASSARSRSWMRKPLIRGVVALVESMVMGTKALTISAQLAGVDEDTGEEMSSSAMAGAIVGGAVMAILIFIVLPAFITNLIMGPATNNPLGWNAVDGLFRVIAFFLYVWLIGFVPDLKRVFMYHGAEHKTIHTLEHGEELTVENARKYSTLHVRCGTAFLLMVMVVSIVVFSLVPVKMIAGSWGVTNKYALLGLVILSRIILMPLVAGLAYEVTVKWAGPRAEHPLVKVVLWPGLQLQRFTTAEPTDDMLECAIRSIEIVLERERQEDNP